ncbi:DarT ssDNA thymidine ADP-ribosyltransferase family protein [Vibrio lentus]
MEKDQIKNIIAQRKIPFLVHFTNLKNLESIFNNGLVPRSQLDASDSEYESNDDSRLDGHEDSVSTSVAFPNCQMFYKLRRNSDDKFCLLALDPELLLNHSSAFCKYNAADAAISSQNIETLKTAEAFEGMFTELATQRSREDQKLKDYDPTDVQAEILVFDTIPKGYIGAVVFPDKETEKQFKGIIGGCKSYVHNPNKGFYGTRTFAREY